MNLKQVVILVFIIFALGGCAYIDQSLKVDSEITIPSSDIGAGKEVSLTALDERSEQMIGNRVGGYGFKAAKITTNQDLAELLKEYVSHGLKRNGFVPVKKDQSPTKMRVELRVLAYDTAMGLWTGGNIGKSTIKVIATSPEGKTYEKTYHGQKEIRTCFIGSQETNSNVVNCAFDDAVNNIFKDKELLNFLAIEK